MIPHWISSAERDTVDSNGLQKILERTMLHQEITDKIIKAFYCVYNILGYGFLEKVYENAMMIELQKMGLMVNQQRSIKVYYV